MTMERIECEFCGQSFDSMEELEDHEMEAHEAETAARQSDR